MASRKSATRSTSAIKPAKRPARKKVAAIPKGFHSLTPYLVVRGADQAIHFYTAAFGAKLTERLAMPDGSVMHAEMRIGNSHFMLSEEFPDWGARSPLLLGGSATHVMIYTRDVDALIARALDAGAHLDMPVADMFWGDRYGKVRDPYGHVWSIATHIEDVPKKEMAKRAAEFMKPNP